MNQNLDISKMTVTELKAIKSDLYEDLERVHRNLQILNAEIANKESKKLEVIDGGK